MKRTLFFAVLLVLILIGCSQTVLEVTFETNGGSPDVVVIYDEEEGLEIPDDPTKEGHTFLGWFLEDTLETPFSVEALLALEPSGSYTVYASWQVNQYTITFDPDNGSPITSITQDYGTPIVAPEEPTKTNFLFMAWNPSLPTTMPAFDMDLKALWEYDPEITGEAPVYQGMDVTAVDPVSTLPQVNYQWSHEQSDIIDDIPIIEIPEQPDIVYYSARNEDVYVRVILDNPDSQVILRFTLNGVVYQSFEFEDGSNSELLIVKVNAGDLSGVRELTIDEIKYIENVSNLTKDADFEGDRTITMAVTYEQLIEASVTEEVVTSTSYRSVITISDPDNLSAIYENPPVFYLSDGTNIIYTQTLTNGNNLIDYPYLHPSQTYVYAVATTYDLLDGEGAQVRMAVSKAMTSEAIVSIEATEIFQEAFNFSLTPNDPNSTGSVTAIELYQGETLIESLSDLSLRQFSNLLSNNAYEIRVTYTYDLNDGNGAQTVTTPLSITTLAKATPSVEVLSVTPEQEALTFDLNITDVDTVGSVSAIELYLNGALVESLSDLSLRQFSNLLSNNAYELRVTYTYDLNDGNGAQTVTTPLSMTTLAKATPNVSSIATVTQESILFDLNITDVDTVGEVTSIELYQGETLIESLSDLSVRSFTGLLSNNAYEIRVTYTYDLNDGLGNQNVIINSETLIASYSVAEWLENKNPDLYVYGEIINIFGPYVILNGASDVVSRDAYTLTIQSEGEDVTHSFAILSNPGVSIGQSISVYNLFYNEDLMTDMATSVSLTIPTTKIITTLIKATPTVELISVTPEQEALSFDLNITDVDTVGSVSAIELYLNGSLVESLSDLSLRTFTGLLSNTEYEIRVTYTYNLNDGLGSISKRFDYKNDYLSLTDVLQSNLASGKVFGYVYSIENGYFIMSDGLKDLNSYDENDDFGISLMYVQGDAMDFDLVVNDLLQFEYTYDFASLSILEGTLKVNEPLGNGLITKAKATPSVGIINVTPTQESISFELDVNDIDSVGTVSSIELYQESTLVQSLTDLSLRTFTGLLSNKKYQIKVTYTYDLNDNSGEKVLVSDRILTNLQTEAIIEYSNATNEWWNNNVQLQFNNFNGNNEYATFDFVGTKDHYYFFKIEGTDWSNNFVEKQIQATGELQKAILDLRELTVEQRSNLSLAIIFVQSVGVEGKLELISFNEVQESEWIFYGFSELEEQVKSLEFSSIRTLSKTMPSVSFGSFNPSQEYFDFNLVLNDQDNIAEIVSIELFQDDVLFQTLSDLQIRRFENLTSNNEYSIKVTYTYDLNEGTGLEINSEVFTAFTLAREIIISSIELYSMESVAVGDEVNLLIEYENPDDVEVSQLTINLDTYNVTKITSTKGLISIGTQEIAGLITLEIMEFAYEGINVTLNSNFIFEFSVADIINILDLKMTNQNVIAEDVENKILINLENKSGYEIESIKIWGYTYPNYEYTYTSNEIIYNESNDIYILEYKGDAKYHEYRDSSIDPNTRIGIKNITYKVNNTLISKEYSYYNRYFILKSGIIRNIVDESDMYELEDGYMYQLTNDLDFDGLEWQPKAFKGALLGNGHKISNVTIDGNADDSYIGFFEKFSGIMENINFSNINIFTMSTSSYFYGGLIIGYNSYSYLNNISIGGTNALTLIRSEAGGETELGGFSGSSNGSAVYKLKVDGDIMLNLSTKPSEVKMGGLFGVFSGTLKYSQVSGKIEVSISNSETYRISIGGLIGRGSDYQINNNMFSGILNVKLDEINSPNNSSLISGINNGYPYHEYDNYYGNIFRGSINTTVLSSSFYSVSSSLINSLSNKGNHLAMGEKDGTSFVYVTNLNDDITYEMLNSIEFYKDILNLDLEYWNLDSLDVENGIFPELI